MDKGKQCIGLNGLSKSDAKEKLDKLSSGLFSVYLEGQKGIDKDLIAKRMDFAIDCVKGYLKVIHRFDINNVSRTSIDDNGKTVRFDVNSKFCFIDDKGKLKSLELEGSHIVDKEDGAYASNLEIK